MDRCAANTRSGKPCKAYPLAGSRYCFAHDPDRAESRSQARSLGGHNRSAPAKRLHFSATDLKTSQGLRAFAEELIRLTREEKISSHRSRTLGYLMLAQRRLIELDDLNQRVQALENVLLQREDPHGQA